MSKNYKMSTGEALLGAFILVSWFGGIALVKGFWLTVGAVCILLYAIYEFIARLLEMTGVLK